MMKILVFAAILCFFGFTAVRSQSRSALDGQRTAKLSVFEGSWKASNIDSSGKPAGDGISSRYTCHWSPNKKFMVCDQVTTVKTTESNNLSIYSYDEKTGNYSLSLVGIPNMAPFSMEVQARGDTLFYINPAGRDAKTFYRTLNVFDSRHSYTYLVQSSTDNTHWKTTMRGRSVKAMP